MKGLAGPPLAAGEDSGALPDSTAGTPSPHLERLALRLLRPLDALCNRLYGHQFNPLYQSGTIVVALYCVLLVTGLWLLLFYRVGAPWESVARITANPWIGNWVRALHRYASDLAVVATAVHAFRMFAQGRSWGPRTLAWVSGGILVFLVMACGWTGYVLVWDTFGQHLAREGARILDALPVLSEPVSRAFTGEQPLPSAFFFLNLFAHVGIPLAMAVVFWLHVKRLARPRLLPPRALMWGVIGGLTAAAIVRGVTIAPRAEALLLPSDVPVDFFFAFWIPITRSMDARSALAAGFTLCVGLLIVPWLARRRDARARASTVDEQLCTGCTQCSIDCPYGAIEMVERTGRGAVLVARVDPALCVSCGICAGSCSPMGVGPPGRSGRDQLARVREFLADPARAPGEIVVICCDHGAATLAPALANAGGVPYPVDCAGNLHTSVVELVLRGGAAGVLVLACPRRDCWHREGAAWLEQRVYHGREAELQARVDRSRVRIANVAAGERQRALEALRAFAADLQALKAPAVTGDLQDERECELARVGDRA